MKKILGLMLALGLAISLAICLAVPALAHGTVVSMTLDSRAGIAAWGSIDHYADLASTDWGTQKAAVATWKHSSWPMISGSSAVWISTAYYVEDPSADSWRRFQDTITIPLNAHDIQATLLKATADNAEEVYCNGNFVGSDGEVQGSFVDNREWQTIISYNISSNLHTGLNTIDFIVRNYPQSGGSQTSNPTGLIYTVTITYHLPVTVNIDIKPGSDPNSINLGDHGVLPVAILGSADFDVDTIDASTITLGGTDVTTRGKAAKLAVSYEDVNEDGYVDLVAFFSVQDLVAEGVLTETTEALTITAELSDGTPIEGTDSVRVVPLE